MNQSDAVLLHIARGECLTGGDAADFELWIELYASLLGCDARAGAVSVAIQELIDRLEEDESYKRKYYAEIRKKSAT